MISQKNDVNEKTACECEKKAHIKYDSSDDLIDDFANDFVDDLVDDFVDFFVDVFVNDFVDDFIHFVDENDVFFVEIALNRKRSIRSNQELN